MDPLYTIIPDHKRIIIPEVLKLISLYALLFFALFLNFKLLKIDSTILLSILTIVLFFAFIVHIFIFSSGKLKIQYYIYPNIIYKMGKKESSLQFYQIKDTALNKNFLDKIFNTSSIILTPTFSIEHIQNGDQIYKYLMQTLGTYQ